MDVCPLEAKALTRAMSGRVILDRLDLRIASGEIVALLGDNGVGKTTLLRCMAGSLRPTSGEVLWFGVSPARRPQARRDLGFAGHESFVYPELTVRENLMFAARMHHVADAWRAVSSLLTRTMLEPHAEQAAGRLSKGMRQRLSIARALIHDPRIVILDEPFTGLDAASRRWLAVWLSELRERGRALCFTSHDAQESLRIANRFIELGDGGLFQFGQGIAA